MWFEFALLVFLPTYYICIVGLAVVKFSKIKEIKKNKLIFAPPLGSIFCVAQHLILIKANAVQFGNIIYILIGIISLIVVHHKKTKASFFRLINYKRTLLCVVVILLVYLTQKFTIAWNYMPLNLITKNGFGMDDTAYHAAISGTFLKQFPLQNPFLRGESLEKAHYMVHCLGAFISILIKRNPLDIFLFSIPFFVLSSIAIQVFYYLNINKNRSLLTAFFGALTFCLGLNGLFIFFPFFGQKLVTSAPEALNFAFWRLPGLGLSFIFIIPMILIITKLIGELSKENIKLLILFILLLAGNLYSKPIAGWCILSAALVLAFIRSPSLKNKKFTIISFLCFFAIVFYLLFLSAKDYGYDQNMPFKPFETASEVFKGISKIYNPKNFLYFKINLMPVFYYIIPIFAFIIYLKKFLTKKSSSSILFLSSLFGFFAFFLLFSPMGAEYQFGIYAFCSANLLFFDQYKETKITKILVAGFFSCSVLFFLAQMKNKTFLDDKFSGVKEITADKVSALTWLNKNSPKDSGFFVNNQHYRNNKTNNAVFCALSERQSYISCYQYSPRTYINKFYGLPSPWNSRLTENEQIFEGNFNLLISKAEKYSIDYVIFDKTVGDIQTVLQVPQLSLVFENSEISIFTIKKN